MGAYFFYEELTPPERQAMGERFRSWGESTLKALNEGQLPPERASAYLVQYYGAHLERSGCDAEAFL
ncbi:MAG TPA: hypothetical protein VN648_22385, partial [Candidatus Methylomirabilis sp.]|nr:hypothetical protein [Candidatus Methylomirabilis sp.]